MYDSLALILYVVEDNPELLILMPQPPRAALTGRNYDTRLCGARDQIQSFVHARKVLYQATPLNPKCFL